MALLLMESCDLGTGTAAETGTSKWAQLSLTDEVIKVGKTSWQSAVENSMQYISPSADEDATVIVGARWLSSGSGTETGTSSQRTIMQFENGATQHVDVRQRGNGTLVFIVGSAVEVGRTPNNTIQANKWNYLEVKMFISETVGTVEMRINGVVVIDETGLDTQLGGSPEIDGFRFGAMRNHTSWWRDIVIMNTAGSTLNDFIGPVVVEAVLPDGAGNYADFTPDTGNNWERVDESDPDDDTSYVETSSAAQRDSYTFGDLSAVTNPPLAVQAMAVNRFTDSPIDMAMMLRRSGTDDDGTPVTPVGTYGYGVREIWEDDPIAAGAWTVANFNATEFGFRTT